MKLFIFLGIIFFNNSFAMNNGRYQCKVFNNLGQSTEEFKFTYLDQELVCSKYYDDEVCEEYFLFSSSRSIYTLNGLENGGFGFDSKGNFVVNSDLGGCDIGKLVLTRSSNFSEGNISSAFYCSGNITKKYSGRVICNNR